MIKYCLNRWNETSKNFAINWKLILPSMGATTSILLSW